MKKVNHQQTPEISGGIVDCEPVPIEVHTPLPYPGDPVYPPAPIAPVIDDPYNTIKL